MRTITVNTDIAIQFAQKLSAGHVFVILLANGYPINVLNRIKAVEEVTSIYCATANPVEVIPAETEQGRGVLGVVDGIKSLVWKQKRSRMKGMNF